MNKIEFSRNWSRVDPNVVADMYELIEKSEMAGEHLPLEILKGSLNQIISPFEMNCNELSIQTIISLMNELCIYTEHSTGRPPRTRHYLRDKDLYLDTATKLPDHLKQPGNVAVLLGCGNMVSAWGFISTVAEISPNIRPVIIDTNIDHFRELNSDAGSMGVVRMTALSTGFATESVALVHSNYVGGQIHMLSGKDGIHKMLKEVHRIVHPEGAVMLVEDQEYFS